MLSWSFLRHSTVWLTLTFLLTAHSLAADANGPPPEFLREIRVVEKAYSNVVIKGRITRKDEGKEATKSRVEYRRMGDKRRLIIQPETKDDRRTTQVSAHVLVASPDTSFFVTRYTDGRATVNYISPQHGVGQDDVIEVMDYYLHLPTACCSFLDEFISDMISDGGMKLGSITIVDRSGQKERIALEVKRLVPREVKKNPIAASPFTHFEGKILVVPDKHWYIEEWQLHRVYKDTLPSSDLNIVISCSNKSGEIPVLEKVTWSSSLVNISLEVEDLQFGAAVPDDFTLKSCRNIVALNLSQSRGSLSRIFWWAAAVFLVCVVIVLLLRFRKRTSKQQGTTG